MLFAVCSLLPGLVLAYKGTSGGGIQTSHPIAELAVRGIRLDGLLLGERDRNVCYCSLAVQIISLSLSIIPSTHHHVVRYVSRDIRPRPSRQLW
jgi:hypothetical protein